MSRAIWSSLFRARAYADFVRQRILAPLGMTDTDFLVPEDKRDRFAACYMFKDGRLELFDDSANIELTLAPPRLQSGGGGLAGTADDYLRFCRMLLGRAAWTASSFCRPRPWR